MVRSKSRHPQSRHDTESAAGPATFQPISQSAMKPDPQHASPSPSRFRPYTSPYVRMPHLDQVPQEMPRNHSSSWTPMDRLYDGLPIPPDTWIVTEGPTHIREQTEQLWTKVEAHTEDVKVEAHTEDVKVEAHTEDVKVLPRELESTPKSPDKILIVPQLQDDVVRHRVENIGSPQYQRSDWNSHRTAASGILSWDLVSDVVGNVVDNDLTARTIGRLSKLYMKHVNVVYPVISPRQLEILIKDFMECGVLLRTPSELQYLEPIDLKRRRLASEKSHSSVDRALVLLILALGQQYDDAPKSAYFPAATQIVAKHLGGSSLCHVKMYLLASIYHGQLAQDTPRQTYLLEAARALHFILEGNTEQYGFFGWDTTLIVLFWIQRLLESELTAERALPESKLWEWDSIVPACDGQQPCGLRIQLQLRNYHAGLETVMFGEGRIQKLYTPFLVDNDMLSRICMTAERQYCELVMIYEPLTFGDHNPDHVLHTRLNAKVSAEMASTLRPCLTNVLNWPNPRVEISYAGINYARRSIAALEFSVACLDLIQDDPLMTHTQWANVMILLVAFTNFNVKHFINPDLLRNLVRQTRNSLLASPSSELQQKYANIMADMALKIGLYQWQIPMTRTTRPLFSHDGLPRFSHDGLPRFSHDGLPRFSHDGLPHPPWFGPARD